MIRVSENAKGHASASIYHRKLTNANTGGPDIGKLDAKIGPKLVEGQFTIPETRTYYGEFIQASVRFRALPPSGAIRSFDDWLDEHPVVRDKFNRIIEIPISLGGAVLLIPFFALVILLLVWGFVIAPRRAARLLRGLELQGYHSTDDENPELRTALNELGPFALEGPLRTEFKEYERKIIGACVQANRRPRYIVNVSQTHDSIGRRGNDIMQIWQTLLLEMRPLDLPDEFYIRVRGTDHFGAAQRIARFGLQDMPDQDLLADFQKEFSVATDGGRMVTVPKALQRAFVSLSELLVRPQKLREAVFRKDLLRSVHTKFCRKGWALCASDVWLRKETLETFVKVGCLSISGNSEVSKTSAGLIVRDEKRNPLHHAFTSTLCF